MNIKHKVIQDFQFVTSDKKIIVLKSNSILENYTYIGKGSGDTIKLEKELIEKNSLFFKPLDWKEELHSFIKANKIPQPAILAKKIIPFIDEMFVNNQSKTDSSTDYKAQINEEDFKFRESQLESKSKRLELLEKQLLEEQQKISDKELDFLRKEKVFSEKLVELESDKTTGLILKKESDDLQKRHLELLNKERELFEKENDLEKIKIREKKLLSQQSELESKIEDFEKRERQIKEKELKIKNIDVDQVVLKEINLESYEKKIELREKQSKLELEELKSKEFFLLQKEKNLNEIEIDLKRKEIDLTKKESDLNTEEINLMDLSHKLENLEQELKIKESKITNFSPEKFLEEVEKLRYVETSPTFGGYFIPKLREVIGLGYIE